MKKNKKLFTALLCLVVAAALAIGIYTFTSPAANEGEKSIEVQVTHKDGSTKSFTYQTEEEYLGTLLLAEGLLEGEEGAFGLYVLTVDGEDAIYEEDGSYWAFYENGEYANQGVDLTPITDGGSYAFVYTVG